MEKKLIAINEKLSDVIANIGIILLFLLRGAAVIASLMALFFVFIAFVSLFTYFPIKGLFTIVRSIFQ